MILKSKLHIAILGAAAAALIAAGLLAGYVPRRATTRALDRAAAQQSVTPPLVNATEVTRAPKATSVSFPGNITPITEAYIYARAAGYLKRRYVDIGDRVRAGQPLADIDAPDLDQQVTQSQAALSQAEGTTRAGRSNTRTTGRHTRSGIAHLEEIRGPHEHRGRISPGRRQCADRSKNSRGQRNGRTEERRRGQGFRARQPGHAGPLIDIAGIREDHRTV